MDLPCLIVVGHGAPPLDAPRELVARLKMLESKRRAQGAAMSPEERDLDAKLRGWPRHPGNDPYAQGFEALVAAVRDQVPGALVLSAYNEFCAPSLEDAVRDAVARGHASVFVVPSMLTPGGVHAEVEIPETLAALREELPGVTLRYAWPFDLQAVAALLVEHTRRLIGP